MNWVDILTIAVALGAALMAGTFFAFSNFVMPALAMQPAPAGVRSMQAINVTVMNPKFLSIFTGTAVLGLVVVVAGVLGGNFWVAAGAASYIVGTFIATMVRNVPMNERLKGLNPDSAEAAAFWTGFLRDWVMWNTIRAAAALFATLLLILGLMQ